MVTKGYTVLARHLSYVRRKNEDKTRTYERWWIYLPKEIIASSSLFKIPNALLEISLENSTLIVKNLTAERYDSLSAKEKKNIGELYVRKLRELNRDPKTDFLYFGAHFGAIEPQPGESAQSLAKRMVERIMPGEKSRGLIYRKSLQLLDSMPKGRTDGGNPKGISAGAGLAASKLLGINRLSGVDFATAAGVSVKTAEKWAKIILRCEAERPARDKDAEHQ